MRRLRRSLLPSMQGNPSEAVGSRPHCWDKGGAATWPTMPFAPRRGELASRHSAATLSPG
eukprot:3481001-Pyramimonas_sp.AAC.1